MIRYRFDIISALKNMGYSTYKIRKEKIFTEGQLQQIRSNKLLTQDALNKVCNLLGCQPGELIEYIPEPTTDLPADENGRDDTDEYIFYAWIEETMKKLPIKERVRIEEEYSKQHIPQYALSSQRDLQILLHSGYIERCKDGYRRVKK